MPSNRGAEVELRLQAISQDFDGFFLQGTAGDQSGVKRRMVMLATGP